jgi:hypothetical protein
MAASSTRSGERIPLGARITTTNTFGCISFREVVLTLSGCSPSYARPSASADGSAHSFVPLDTRVTGLRMGNTTRSRFSSGSTRIQTHHRCFGNERFGTITCVARPLRRRDVRYHPEDRLPEWRSSVDASVLGADEGNLVWVRVPPRAPAVRPPIHFGKQFAERQDRVRASIPESRSMTLMIARFPSRPPLSCCSALYRACARAVPGSDRCAEYAASRTFRRSFC